MSSFVVTQRVDDGKKLRLCTALCNMGSKQRHATAFPPCLITLWDWTSLLGLSYIYILRPPAPARSLLFSFCLFSCFSYPLHRPSSFVTWENHRSLSPFLSLVLVPLLWDRMLVYNPARGLYYFSRFVSLALLLLHNNTYSNMVSSLLRFFYNKIPQLLLFTWFARNNVWLHSRSPVSDTQFVIRWTFHAHSFPRRYCFLSLVPYT